MTVDEILKKLESLGSPENVAGMARYGITTKKAFGVTAPHLKSIAKEIRSSGIDRHKIALELWRTEVHEARAVAYLVEDPKLVSPEQMESWVADFDNWAICDSTCGTLFSRTRYAYQKAIEWTKRDEELVRRAGIAMIAWLSVHDKRASDEIIATFLPVLQLLAGDERNLVKKAVSWALRTIGKRNQHLNTMAIETAEIIKVQGSTSARWIAADALRELRSKKLVERLETK